MNFDKEWKISQETLKQYEITKEEAEQLPVGTSYIVYNPLTNQYKEENASPIDIVHNRYCYNKLKFYKYELMIMIKKWSKKENKYEKI